MSAVVLRVIRPLARKTPTGSKPRLQRPMIRLVVSSCSSCSLSRRSPGPQESSDPLQPTTVETPQRKDGPVAMQILSEHSIRAHTNDPRMGMTRIPLATSYS